MRGMISFSFENLHGANRITDLCITSHPCYHFEGGRIILVREIKEHFQRTYIIVESHLVPGRTGMGTCFCQ